MELLQAIRERRSVREYTGRSVIDAVLRELIEAAIQAPSAINQQPSCLSWSRTGPGQSALAEGPAQRAGPSLPRHAERSEIRHLLQRARADRDRRGGAHRLGSRGLRARRREFDAGGA